MAYHPQPVSTMAPTSTASCSSRMSIDSLLNPPMSPAPRPRSLHRQHYYHSDDYAHPHPSPGSSTHSDSVTSSPSPYTHDERLSSVPSTVSYASSHHLQPPHSYQPTHVSQERRRPPRPKYDEEEMFFIWYHRVDLHQEWKDVRESFNAQFPSRQRSGFQGIQCKYYRFLRDNNCPTLREQRRCRGGSGGSGGSGASDESAREDGEEDLPAFGVVRWTGRKFAWMKAEHINGV